MNLQFCVFSCLSCHLIVQSFRFSRPKRKIEEAPKEILKKKVLRICRVTVLGSYNWVWLWQTSQIVDTKIDFAPFRIVVRRDCVPFPVILLLAWSFGAGLWEKLSQPGLFILLL